MRNQRDSIAIKIRVSLENDEKRRATEFADGRAIELSQSGVECTAVAANVRMRQTMLASRHDAYWSRVSAMNSENRSQIARRRLTGHDKKRGGRRKEAGGRRNGGGMKGGRRYSETVSSFEHPKKGNARTPVDLR